MEPTQKNTTSPILSSSKKMMGMVIILVVAIAVPLTLGLIKQNQDNRQQAAVDYTCPAGSTQIGLTPDTACPICETNGTDSRWSVAECSNSDAAQICTVGDAESIEEKCENLPHSCNGNETVSWQCLQNSAGTAGHCAHTCTPKTNTSLNLKVSVAMPGSLACGNATYTWDSISNAVTYKIYRSQDPVKIEQSNFVEAVTKTTVIDPVKPLGSTYYVTVIAESDMSGTEITREQKSFTMPASCTATTTVSPTTTNTTKTPNGGACSTNGDCASGVCDKPNPLVSGSCKAPATSNSSNLSTERNSNTSGGSGTSATSRDPGTSVTVTPTPITYNPVLALRAYTLLDTDGDGRVSVGNTPRTNVPITLKKGTTVVQTVNTGTNGMAAFTIRQSGTYTVTAGTATHAYNSPNPSTVVFGAGSASQNVFFAVKSTVTPTATKTPTPTKTPTGTRVPSPSISTTVTTTQAAGSMTLAVQATLPGIGSRSGDTTTPRTPNRQAQVQIFNTSNEQVKSSTASLTYQNGTYSGSTNISGLAAGTYYIKIGMNNTLFTQLPGVTNLVVGANNLTSIQLIPGDINQDNNLNMIDHSIFIGCYGQKPCTTDQKAKSDFNDDGVVDGKDYNILLRSFAIRSGD